MTILISRSANLKKRLIIKVRVISDVIWLILDLNAQYFDIWMIGLTNRTLIGLHIVAR